MPVHYAKSAAAIGICLCILTVALGAEPNKPSSRSLSAELSEIDTLVKAEITKGRFPGAVVLVGRGNDTLYFKAFGASATHPSRTPMQRDAIFDLASLSKPVATATSILVLIDRKQIDPNDRVVSYLPEFGRNGKEDVRIGHLLAHTSGLQAYTSAATLRNQYGPTCPDQTLATIYALRAQSQPGKRRLYSCLGYIVLGRIVEVVSGQTLDVFAYENIFEPLEMTDTFYNPPDALNNRIAATGQRSGIPSRGSVHDPLAALMGGISGNAGLFSTASDLARYCRMVLNQGRSNGRQILSESSLALLTTEQAFGRTFGFDIRDSNTHLKGDSFGPYTFSHSGYTGTSIVCDPETNIFIIILTNRTYPGGQGSAATVRRQVANRVAEIVIRTD